MLQLKALIQDYLLFKEIELGNQMRMDVRVWLVSTFVDLEHTSFVKSCFSDFDSEIVDRLGLFSNGL